jgi:hypothetical protein
MGNCGFKREKIGKARRGMNMGAECGMKIESGGGAC